MVTIICRYQSRFSEGDWKLESKSLPSSVEARVASQLEESTGAGRLLLDENDVVEIAESIFMLWKPHAAEASCFESVTYFLQHYDILQRLPSFASCRSLNGVRPTDVVSRSQVS